MQLYLGYQDRVDVSPHYLNPYRTCGDTSVPSWLLWLSEAGRQADIKGELW